MSKRIRLATAALACALTVALSLPVMAWAAIQTNYEWYRGHESDSAYTISTAGQLAALAQLVNGTADFDKDGTVDSPAVSFQGKTITVSGSGPQVLGFLGNAITPIGTKEHPFEGTFDGNGWEVANFKLTVAAADSGPVSNVGVFGYVGSHGSVRNLNVAASSSISIIRSASSTDYVTNVGMVVGYCAGTVTNCSNAGTLAITSEVVQRSAADYLPVRNIGGVAGQCVYDMVGCSNSGSVKVNELSSPVASIEHAQLVARVGGVVGLLGDESLVGTYNDHKYADPEKHGSIRDCSNTGAITIDTPKLSGLDRFGKQTNAESVAIGGVVGYSQGSIANCVNGLARGALADSNYKNQGYVRAENGVMVGGVCGSLRGVLADNTNIAWADDGAQGTDPLVMSACRNYGDVYGRSTIGGVVGKASSFTTVTECMNACKQAQTAPGVYAEMETFVVATRWNKPTPGGIAGTSNGEVSYCANLATVASAIWNDEGARTLVTQDGYYASGIVGALTYFDDRAPANGGLTTPISEVFSCYNAGTIIAGSNMRQRGIVGENSGYTHDNVLVKGVVYDDEIVYGDSPDEPEASGTVGENRLYSAGELRGAKAAEAVAFLNSNSEANGWQRYWTIARDAAANALNAGFPLLNSQDPWGDEATSLAAAQTALAKDAPYTGGESAPDATVTLNGASLTQNADFRVIPQAGATEVSTGAPYRATIVGLGRYRGEASAKVAYDIVSGGFDTCSVTVVAHTFDYEAYVPKPSEVTVRTPAGTVVDPGEYDYSIVDEDGNAIAPVDADMYRILVVPNAEGSKHFSGKLEGTYRIKPASYMREVSFDNAKISYLGVDYPWVDSKGKGESDNPKTSLPYTGVAVKPAVGTLTYKGHTLVEGKDYRVVYGNSNSDDGFTGDQDANNMGKKGGTSIGCVTIRYISGKKTNFTSYANMFFKIVDEGSKTDLAKARAVVEGDQVSDGKPITPVQIWLGNTRLAEGTDYTISYSNNVKPGTASFTATGKGNFTGKLSGTFTIEEGSVYEFTFAYAGAGTQASPYEATVTGVDYLSSRETFDMAIPATVTHDGHDYAVTAIGEAAFGGKNSSAFSGSGQNESKLKIGSVTIPATVRSIGKYAFGTNDITMAKTPPIGKVEFAAGSQLQEIGEYAFSRCDNLKSITIPAGVKSIGDYAFQSRGSGYGLEEIRFLTTAPTMPEKLYGSTFRYCVGVTVRGNDSATAVKAIAANNSADSSSGANGGRKFTFQAFNAASGLVVADIASQTYTGSAIAPAMKLTLGGSALTEGTDYQVSYAGNVNAGVATATASGLGAYGFEVSKTFTISPCPLSKVEFAPISDQVYSGKALTLTGSLALGGIALKPGVDYSVSYADASGRAIAAPSATGSYRLVATGRGNFSGSRYRALRIVPTTLENAEVTIGDREFTGVAVEPDPEVRFAGSVLERDKDYTLAYADNVAIGEASATIRGMGGFSGEKAAKFRIVQASIDDALVAGVSDIGTGDPASFDPVVVKGGVKLAAGTDFTVSYEKVTSAGTSSAPLAATALSADGALEAGGTGGLVAASLTGEGVAAPLAAQEDTAQPLDAAPTEVGNYNLVITGTGKYRGTARVAFAIGADAPAAKTSLGDATVTAGAATYNGAYCMPELTVVLGDKSLEEGKDFIASYEGNATLGAASATVYGIGDYEGSATGAFTVAKARIEASHVKPVGALPYTGSAIEPKVGVVVAGRSLVEGKDYSLAYSDNEKPGTARVRVMGMGGYEGDVTVPFAIESVDISGAVTSAASQVYTGAPLRPAVKVLLDGSELLAGSDYTVDYRDNVNVGTAAYTVTGTGIYSGTVTGTFAITAKPADPAAPADDTPADAPKADTTKTDTTKADTAQTAAPAGQPAAPAGEPASPAPKPIGAATVSAPPATFNGTAQLPAITVMLGGVALAAGDYTVSYADALGNPLAATSLVNAGTYAITVTGQGAYTGTASGSYTIERASLASAGVSGLSDVTYTGSPHVQTPVVTVGAMVLAPGIDFAYETAGNVNAGTATVSIRGMGNFTDSIAASFNVQKASQAISAKNVKKTYKGKKLVKKKKLAKLRTIKLKGAAKVSAKTTVTFAKKNKAGGSKIKVNKKTGKLTLKKGLKKGTYKVKVKLSAAADANYKAAKTKVITVTVKIK